MVGGEDHRALEALQVLEALDLHPREDPADRQDPGRQAGVPHPRERQRRFQVGKMTGPVLGRRVGGRLGAARRRLTAARRSSAPLRRRWRLRPPSLRDRRPSVASANAASSIVVWACSSIAISNSTRSSELRPSASIVVSGPMSVRPGAKRCTAARTLVGAAIGGAAAGAPRRRRPSASPRAVSACACLRCAAARRPARPRRCGSSGDRRASRWRAGRRRRDRSPGRRRPPRGRAPRRSRSGRPPPRPCTPAIGGERALDVLGEDVQPLGRDDHLLLAALDVDAALLVDAADVAGVQPAVLERLRRRLGRAVVALGDVVAADEDLAVLGDPHLDAGDRLADRSARAS